MRAESAGRLLPTKAIDIRTQRSGRGPIPMVHKMPTRDPARPRQYPLL